MYCFIAQDTEEGSGEDMLQNILTNCQFLQLKSGKLLADNWIAETISFSLKGEMT